jgi:hypothetical protein
MVKLGRLICIIFLSSFLFGCASARMAEEVQSGKATFDEGNFKEAFAALLPLAVKCSAEAQYAVGYMYYYGLGVEAHKESGLFWITQSAQQMYRPAIKALKLIEKDKNEIKEPSIKKSNKLRYSENALAESLNNPGMQKKIATIKKENEVQLDPLRMAVKATPENKEDDVLLSLKDLNPRVEMLAKKIEKPAIEAKPLELAKNSTYCALPREDGCDLSLSNNGNSANLSLAPLTLIS